MCMVNDVLQCNYHQVQLYAMLLTSVIIVKWDNVSKQKGYTPHRSLHKEAKLWGCGFVSAEGTGIRYSR